MCLQGRACEDSESPYQSADLCSLIRAFVVAYSSHWYFTEETKTFPFRVNPLSEGKNTILTELTTQKVCQCSFNETNLLPYSGSICFMLRELSAKGSKFRSAGKVSSFFLSLSLSLSLWCIRSTSLATRR